MKTYLSKEAAAQKIAKMARKGVLGYNTHMNVKIRTTPIGKTFVDMCSEKDLTFNSNTRSRAEIYEDEYGDTRIIFQEHPRNTADVSKIDDMYDNMVENWGNY
jgi:hypothetical protein